MRFLGITWKNLQWYRKWKGGIWHFHKTYYHYWCQCTGWKLSNNLPEDCVMDGTSVYRIEQGWIHTPPCCPKNNHYVKFYCNEIEDYTFPKVYLLNR